MPEKLKEIQSEIKGIIIQLMHPLLEMFIITIFILLPSAANLPENETLMHPDYFNVHNLFTVQDLFNARVHYGHKVGTLDQRMLPYVFGKRMDHIIFDLDTTALYLRKALNFAAHIAHRDGLILFVCRNAQFTHLIEETAKECNEYAHCRPWRPGVFTNPTTHFGEVTRLPDLCIFFNTLDDVLKQHWGITEAAKLCIPTIGVVDSNCNPNLISYPIPGNDDSLVSVQFYAKIFKEAILRGKRKLAEDIANEERESLEQEKHDASIQSSQTN